MAFSDRTKTSEQKRLGLV